MTGPEGVRRYEKGASQAELAARSDAQWAPFAGAWRIWVAYSESIQSGASPVQTKGLQAGREIAAECGKLLYH